MVDENGKSKVEESVAGAGKENVSATPEEVDREIEGLEKKANGLDRRYEEAIYDGILLKIEKLRKRASVRTVSGHIFRGPYASTNPCVVCGAWEDEAKMANCTKEKRMNEMKITFVQLDPRKSSDENPDFQIGIEITEKKLWDVPGKRRYNFDHHQSFANAETPSACEQARKTGLEFLRQLIDEERATEEIVIALLRPDADSVTAAAIFKSLVEWRKIDKKIVEAVDIMDRKGPQAMEEYKDLYNETAAIARKSADFKIPLEQRVEFVQSVLDGTVNRKEIDQLVAEREKEFEEARKHSEIEVVADGKIAVVKGNHRFAMNLGYENADIIVATNPEMPVMDRNEETGQMKPTGEKYVKHTVARRNQFVPVDLPAALIELQEREQGWGGRGDIFGSPQNRSSNLTTEQVVEIVKKHLQ